MLDPPSPPTKNETDKELSQIFKKDLEIITANLSLGHLQICIFANTRYGKYDKTK